MVRPPPKKLGNIVINWQDHPYRYYVIYAQPLIENWILKNSLQRGVICHGLFLFLVL